MESTAMTLLLTQEETARYLDLESAITAIEGTMIEEIEGTTLHMPSYGGSKSSRKTIRTVGGGLYGLGSMGIRAGNVVQIFDTESGQQLAIVASASHLRLSATLGLAARYLARPDAHRVGLLGTGRNALPILEGLRAVRPIQHVSVYSPTAAHLAAFVQRASAALDCTIEAGSNEREAIQGADIVVAATSSRTPVLSFPDLAPGTHLTGMGMSTEMDDSVYLNVDQFIVPNRELEIECSGPSVHPYIEGNLYHLVRDGRYDPSHIVELGSIIRGDVAPRNGPSDINLFRDARGGVGDVALAHLAYQRAKADGVGTEIRF
jgi:ornithine cyclodeaminase/alanine dehydrogenase-like protein (mu-crystallin family)